MAEPGPTVAVGSIQAAGWTPRGNEGGGANSRSSVAIARRGRPTRIAAMIVAGTIASLATTAAVAGHCSSAALARRLPHDPPAWRQSSTPAGAVPRRLRRRSRRRRGGAAMPCRRLLGRDLAGAPDPDGYRRPALLSRRRRAAGAARRRLH